MDLLSMLLVYLAIAAAIHWVLSLKFMGPLRQAMDILANRATPNLRRAVRFSHIGDQAAYESQAGVDSHEATVGIRMLATFLSVTLIGAFGFGHDSEPLLGQGRGPFLTFAALVLIAGFYLIYMWTYRIDISRDALSVPTFFLTRRVLDPRRLVRIEDDGAYALRLYFEDGKRADVLKYVTGRQALLARLTAEVNRNARA